MLNSKLVICRYIHVAGFGTGQMA